MATPSDRLCRASAGEAPVKRRLYQDLAHTSISDQHIMLTADTRRLPKLDSSSSRPSCRTTSVSSSSSSWKLCCPEMSPRPPKLVRLHSLAPTSAPKFDDTRWLEARRRLLPVCPAEVPRHSHMQRAVVVRALFAANVTACGTAASYVSRSNLCPTTAYAHHISIVGDANRIW